MSLATMGSFGVLKRAVVAATLATRYLGNGFALAANYGSNPNRFRDLADFGLDINGNALQEGVSTESLTAAANETIVAEYIELPLDHFGGNEGTFMNRFWVAEAAYKPGEDRPVFIYDVGEADAGNSYLRRLQAPDSFFKQMVDAYGGIGIVWEHRFYGNSTPVEINLDTPPEAFRFLTTEQSLEDVKVFAENFKRKNFPDVDFTPNGSPWVFVGGSYPGMRAAFMREFYPDTITASFASSAPVEAAVDMSVYFEPVYRGMNRYGYGNCTADIHAAINWIDNELSNDKKAAALKIKFLGRGADKNSNAGFADALTTIFYLWQSYGMDTILRPFCDHLALDPSTGKNSPAKGWAPSKGAAYVVDRWSTWNASVSNINSFLETTCEGPGADPSTAPTECDLERRFTDPATISWTWQYCTQWGFLQSANLGPTQLVSKYNSLQHQADICHRQFPTAKEPLFPAWPRVKDTNAHFGGWDIRPSNVYWSGGEFDPWRTLSPLSSEKWAPKPKLTQQAPRCDVETGDGEIFGYTIANAQHCYDFRTTVPDGAVSRGFFTKALDGWLACWKNED